MSTRTMIIVAIVIAVVVTFWLMNRAKLYLRFMHYFFNHLSPEEIVAYVKETKESDRKRYEALIEYYNEYALYCKENWYKVRVASQELIENEVAEPKEIES